MRPDPQKEVDMPEHEYRGYHIQASGFFNERITRWDYWLGDKLKGTGSSVEACEERIDEDLDEGDEG